MQFRLSHTLRGCVDWNLNKPSVTLEADGHTLRGCVDWNSINMLFAMTGNSHTLRGCVDWNLKRERMNVILRSHTLRGCVDWNKFGTSVNKHIQSHTLRGCVDWNIRTMTAMYPYVVTPCVGVWIETTRSANFSFKSPCHTLRGCVDWNSYGEDLVTYEMVTPCVGVWIETYWILNKRLLLQSHPAWVCGLKLGSLRRIHYGRCHTLRGCVDWNNDEVNTCIDNHSHTLRGCIWIEALFTRWSSLWKNCKHSASCVFLFKLL